ncbi:SH3 domain-containing protein [Geosmithia morbida]|uniref:SH3 domain-containing protein n=1 Tax=Geosmithia morbida TaxID=1094350 RepID=A0A9P4Z3J5_9HYPO|nr:SH3 domain-containing protein [Geosmithia morbida]KAF4126802.1 SH3 domain-containing protein [Geosmithia morbida]
MRGALVALLSVAPTLIAAQSDCISLKGSSTCPAFESASISKDESLIQSFPFLDYVTDTSSFDSQFLTYVQTTYVRSKYENVFGCDDVDLKSADYYARYTMSVLCNSMVQKSADACDLSSSESIPLCADSCAEFAQSASYVTSDTDLCTNPVDDLTSLIRADFVTCSLPGKSLSGNSCIDASENESQNCGFANSTLGFCWYCSEGGINSTDTCCYNGNAEDRCKGVKLPTITSTIDFETPTSTAEPTSSSSPDDDDDGGLSGGAIAGIVIGAIVGAAIIALALFFCIRRMKKRPGSQQSSIFNQPSPSRGAPSVTAATAPSMTQARPDAPQGYEVLPGGRIARMSALEGHSDRSSQHRGKSATAAGVAAGAAAGYAGSRRKGSHTQSSSSEYGESPHSDMRTALRPPLSAQRRNGSLSSNSILAASAPHSPTSAEGFSSPQGVSSQQSEQLPFFKDYYSQDDIHPGDRVAVLWAYQPRAADEFALDRGDMLKVVGIWDDGWATGILVDERAEDWEARHNPQRDSGVSHASGRRGSSPPGSGEIKAFPLVCVCLPDHWRKTIEGDGSTESGSNGAAPQT